MSGSFWKQYLVTFVAFLVLDAVWLTLIAPRFYQAQIGSLMAARPKLAAAGVFYLLYVAGLVVFCVSPGVRQNGLGWTAWRGALFGMVAYGTYALTNLAVLEGWPLLVTIVDLAWGIVLSTAATVVGVWLSRLWG